MNLTTIDLLILRVLRFGPRNWHVWYTKRAAVKFLLRYQKNHPDWDPKLELDKARQRGEIQDKTTLADRGPRIRGEHAD